MYTFSGITKLEQDLRDGKITCKEITEQAIAEIAKKKHFVTKIKELNNSQPLKFDSDFSLSTLNGPSYVIKYKIDQSFRLPFYSVKILIRTDHLPFNYGANIVLAQILRMAIKVKLWDVLNYTSISVDSEPKFICNQRHLHSSVSLQRHRYHHFGKSIQGFERI